VIESKKGRTGGFPPALHPHTFLVIAGQFAVIATILLLWIGQDLTYSPGWAHPMAYYFAIAVAIIVVFGITGIVLRKGTPRLD